MIPTANSENVAIFATQNLHHRVMDLRQLQAFVLVAQHLNFGEAARRMCIAQSSLSQCIKNLEAEMHVELFQRDSHSVRLTEAGSEMLPYALRTLQEASYCYNRIADLKGLECGHLVIGATTAFKSLVNEAVLRFIQQYPKINLHLRYHTAPTLVRLLREGEIDCFLAYRPEAAFPDIEVQELFADQIVAIVRQGHALASRQEISLSDLQRHSLALTNSVTQTRQVINRLCERQGIRLNPHLEINEAEPLLHAVRCSHIVALLSRATADNAFDLCQLPLSDPGSHLVADFHLLRGAYQKQSLLRFRDILFGTSTLYRLRSV